jgi:putative ABC transport system ATP-binding protein
MFINLKNAVKKYGAGETEIYALDHADLELEEGQICVILGPSGSGKSLNEGLVHQAGGGNRKPG